MERILASVKVKHKDGKLGDGNTLTTAGRDGEIDAINGACKSSGAAKDRANTAEVDALSELTGSNMTAKTKNSGGNGTKTSLDDSECVTDAEVQLIGEDSKNKKYIRRGEDSDKVTGKVCLCITTLQ